MTPNRLSSVKCISLPRHSDIRGHLTIIGHQDIPFSIARIFYVTQVPKEAVRGGHAHRVTEQFIIAMSGQFKLDLTDSHDTLHFDLHQSGEGVYVPPMIWDRLYDFSADAICLVLASTPYAESDYIRRWEDYLAAVK